MEGHCWSSRRAGGSTFGQGANQGADTGPEAPEVNAPPERAQAQRDGMLIGHANTQDAAPDRQESAAEPEADGSPGEPRAGALPVVAGGGVGPGALSSVRRAERTAHHLLHFQLWVVGPLPERNPDPRTVRRCDFPQARSTVYE